MRALTRLRASGSAGWALAVLVPGLLTLGGCAAPGYRFEASAADDVVVKVPRTWTVVRSGVPATTDGSAAPDGAWVTVFDGASKPSLTHVQTGTPSQPIGVVLTIPVTKDEAAGLTVDDLRDLITPVSAVGRSRATLSGQAVPPFTMVSDQEWKTSTARGIHVVFRYAYPAGDQTFDQVAVTNTSKTRIHVFLVRCATSCYAAHHSEIATAITSFTVRTP